MNSSSAHTHSTFKAIPDGVFKRLSRLTSKEESVENLRVDQLYPDHAQALKNAKLYKKSHFPTMKELWDKDRENSKRISMEKKRTKDTRNIFFCIGKSNFWKTPIHQMIRNLIKKTPKLSWIRVNLFQHRFPNLGELYYGDLAGKVRKDVRSLDFTHKKTCNCSKNMGNEPGVTCAMGGRCLLHFIIYKATCGRTGKYYIGSTHCNFKKRMSGHFTDVGKLVEKGIT